MGTLHTTLGNSSHTVEHVKFVFMTGYLTYFNTAVCAKNKRAETVNTNQTIMRTKNPRTYTKNITSLMIPCPGIKYIIVQHFPSKGRISQHTWSRGPTISTDYILGNTA
jgi:hypothetical protein